MLRSNKTRREPGAFPHKTSASNPWLFKAGPLLLGVLMLSGLIVVVAYFSEIERFVHLVRQIAPVWLIAGGLLQVATYISTAAIWRQTLKRVEMHFSVRTLLPLSVAKLFSEQAFPSGGISGTAFFVTALQRRGIPSHLCMAALLVSLVSYYTAYLFAALVSLALMRFYHAINLWVISVTVLFCIAAVIMPVGILWLRRLSGRRLPAPLMRIPGLNQLLTDLGSAPAYLLRDISLFAQTTLLHGSIFILDSVTLWVMLRAVGQSCSFLVAFPSFVVASMVATLGLVPLGLGTFEATCIAMLRAMGIPIETALTATLLLRGFTLWLPMVPGLWLAKREMSGKDFQAA